MDFEILGLLPQSQSIAGRLRANGQSRLLAITLNEDDAPGKRKKHNDAVRAELDQPIRSLKDGSAVTLHKKFNLKAMADMRARIDLPAYADETLQLIASEDKVPPLVILDCANRASFWAGLKALDVSEDAMLQLAELAVYAPQHQRKDAAKPIGDVHHLCQRLAKLKWNSDEIDMIASAQKFRLPDMDWVNQIEAAEYEIELKNLRNFLAGRKFKGVFNAVVGSILFVNRQVNRLGYKLPATLPDLLNAHKRNSDKVVKMMAETSGDKSLNTFPHGFQEVQGSDKEYVGQFLKKWNIESLDGAENKDFGDVYLYSDRLAVPRMKIRNGFHFLPHDKCLFEFNTLHGKDTIETRTYVLATKEGPDSIRFKMFHIAPDGKLTYQVDDRFVHLKKGRFHSIGINEKDGEINIGKNPGGAINLMQIAHALNAISRIHEPGYENYVVTPPKNRVSVGKHAYPYFEYHDVFLDGTASDYILVGKGGGISGTQKRRHIVRGHPRRFRDEGGNILEITFIGPHLRGDAARGFVGKSYVVR